MKKRKYLTDGEIIARIHMQKRAREQTEEQKKKETVISGRQLETMTAEELLHELIELDRRLVRFPDLVLQYSTVIRKIWIQQCSERRNRIYEYISRKMKGEK